ncbi:hypothetical protein GOBAR_AA04804 [Gossypium barbadense]|uniref:Uncharacterized protein n=1 Tax=Gossypium barbadense TaxID=3634 RepID=A0A2P5YJN0_GOSBA|nr:hypothetical protein GOBAR_AA04804 [Gossypium barbadense]
MISALTVVPRLEGRPEIAVLDGHERDGRIDGAPIPDNITISGNSQQEMPDNYVNGAFVYDVGDGFIWIVFWTKNNQVSTKIFIRYNDSTEPNNSILWHQVVNNLHPRLSEDCAFGYTARARIEPNANGQVLTANISRVSSVFD